MYEKRYLDLDWLVGHEIHLGPVKGSQPRLNEGVALCTLLGDGRLWIAGNLLLHHTKHT